MRTLREKNTEQIEKFKSIKQKKILNTLTAAEKSDDYIPYVRESDAADQHLGINAFQSEAAEVMLNKQLEPGQKVGNVGRNWHFYEVHPLKTNFSQKSGEYGIERKRSS